MAQAARIKTDPAIAPQAQPAQEERAAPGRVNDPDRTRNDILDVAASHFATNGLSGSRVDDIAEETHTSKRMLYYYFGSKEGLFRAVLARAYDGIRRHEAEIDVDALPPRAALQRLVEVTFDHHLANPDFVRLVMTENIHRGRHIAQVEGLDLRAGSVLAIIGRLLARGEASGDFRSGIDPLDVHLTMSALSFYNVSNRHTIARIFDRDLADEAVLAARRQVVVDTVMRWICTSVA